VLAGVLGLDFPGPGCGRSTVRVAPDGRVLPCTYWPSSRIRVDDLVRLGEAIVETPEFADARHRPPACEGCPCRGGCAGRRALGGRLDEPDPYCPFARGQHLRLHWERALTQDLPKLGSACTTVVSAS
jgi:radical SAM protein with 4Fe4S-binding SPASM domain